MTRAVPNVFASLTTPSLPNLDNDFTALTPTVVLPCTATGTNGITLTPVASTLTVSAYTDKDRFSFNALNTSTGVMTLQVGALAALNLYKAGGTVQASSGDVVAGQYYDVAYQASLNSNAGGFVIVNATLATVTSSVSGSRVATMWGAVSGAGATVQYSFAAPGVGPLAVTHSGTGITVVNFSSMASAAYAVTVTPIFFTNLGGTVGIYAGRQNPSSFTVFSFNTTNGAGLDIDYNFAVFGP